VFDDKLGKSARAPCDFFRSKSPPDHTGKRHGRSLGTVPQCAKRLGNEPGHLAHVCLRCDLARPGSTAAETAAGEHLGQGSCAHPSLSSPGCVWGMLPSVGKLFLAPRSPIPSLSRQLASDAAPTGRPPLSAAHGGSASFTSLLAMSLCWWQGFLRCGAFAAVPSAGFSLRTLQASRQWQPRRFSQLHMAASYVHDKRAGPLAPRRFRGCTFLRLFAPVLSTSRVNGSLDALPAVRLCQLCVFSASCLPLPVVCLCQLCVSASGCTSLAPGL
jgi:hypothetical protein